MFLFLAIPLWCAFGFIAGYGIGMMITGADNVEPRTRDCPVKKGQRP